MKFFLSICVFLNLFCSAEELYNLTLEGCINLAKQRSPSAQIAKQEFESGRWKYAAFSASLKPQIGLQSTLPDFTRSINSVVQPDGSVQFTTQNQAYSSLNLSITQEILPLGGSLFATSSLSRIDLFENDHTFFWQASPIVVGINQPLFKFNSLAWSAKTERLNYELSKRKYDEALEDVAIEITRKFFNYYLATVEVEIAAFNTAVNDTIYTISSGRYTVGKIAEDDLLQSELALMDAQTSLEQSRLDMAFAYADLKLAVGLEGQDSLIVLPPEEIPEFQLDTQRVLQFIREHHSSYILNELQNVEAEKNLKRTRSGRFFSANISASLGFNQTADVLGSLYDNPLDRENVTLSLEIPLNQGVANANLLRTLAEREQIRISTENNEQLFEQQSEYTLREFELLKRQLVIAARADTVANLQFKVAKNRYLIGKIDITNLFYAQRGKDSARRTFFQTLKKFWISYYEIRKLAHYDFSAERPLGKN
ncbi:MAG: TolC family protein [FCB group bacterium]|nr:TolC family protein [FCB group bacterium]